MTVGYLPSAFAHPHVWVTAQSTILFRAGEITGLRHRWTFDAAFSSFAIQGLDENGDGELSRAELQPLAEINVTSLHEYDFFTHMQVGNVAPASGAAQFKAPTDYWLSYAQGQLTLTFDLPLVLSVTAGEQAVRFDITDPSFYVDFRLTADDAATLQNAPEGCRLHVERPQPLDAEIEAKLAAIPADQQVPEDLIIFTEEQSNAIIVACAGQ